jgi:outer membrane immunogenic protein
MNPESEEGGGRKAAKPACQEDDMRITLSVGLLFAVLLAAPVAVSAQTTDNTWLWNGAHVGINLGWGSGNDPGTTQCTSAGIANGTGCIEPIYLGGMRPSGILGGGQLGWDSAGNGALFGVEADFQASDIGGSRGYSGTIQDIGTGSVPNIHLYASQHQNWFSTVRVRVGVLMASRSLLYLTGGFAEGSETLSTNDGNSTQSYSGTTTTTQPGWVGGAGYEWRLGKRTTARVEVLDYWLRPYTQLVGTTPATPFMVGKDFYFSGAIVRVGMNWRI